MGSTKCPFTASIDAGDDVWWSAAFRFVLKQCQEGKTSATAAQKSGKGCKTIYKTICKTISWLCSTFFSQKDYWQVKSIEHSSSIFSEGEEDWISMICSEGLWSESLLWLKRTWKHNRGPQLCIVMSHKISGRNFQWTEATKVEVNTIFSGL